MSIPKPMQKDITSLGDDTGSTEPIPTIIDVPPPARWAMGIVLVFLIPIPFAVLLVQLSDIIPPVEWMRQAQPFFFGMMAGLSMGLVFLVAMKVYAPFLRFNLRRELQPNAASSLASALSNALPFTSYLMKQYLQTTARHLAESGMVGTTIRVCEKRHAKPVEPLTLIIEPLALDESMPAVGRIASGDFAETPDMSGELRGKSNASALDNMQLRSVRRSIALFGGWAILLLVGFYWLSLLVISVKNWRIDPSFLFVTALFLLVLFSPLGRGAMTSRKQWFLVPGGLIGRKANWRGGWNVHLFDRRSSVLAVHRVWSQWYACVADAETHQSVTITPTEVKALLSAWLSPLPPPQREQLTELAG